MVAKEEELRDTHEAERLTDEQMYERERRIWLRQKYPRLSEDEEPNTGDVEYE